MDHGIEIERRVRDGLIEIGKKLGIPPVVTNDSHYTREQDAQSHDMLLCIQTGKNLADTDRFRFDGTGYYIKPADEMYAIDRSDLWQEGCRNSQLLIADRVDTSRHVRVRQPDAEVPHPGGLRLRGRPVPGRGLEGHGAPLPERVRRPAPPAGRVRDRDHLPDGVPGLLPGRRGLHHVGQEQRRRGRPRPRLRGRLDRRLRDGHHRPRPARPRADLRAVPQPRARLHARHRHRLRRTWPGRRDQVRDREVGLGQGRADRHLRHDQGQGRDQGLLPGARLPVRAGRPDHQGVPAGRDGQGHPAVRDLRREPPALQRGRRAPVAVRDRGGDQAGHRHRPRASRG